MLSYAEFIKENLVYSNAEMPKEGGCCLILSKPYPDGLKRLFIGIIDKVRGPREVIFVSNFYIIKEYKDGIIWAENVGDVRNALNMKTFGLTLNNNKTPFWYNSIRLSKNQFLKNNQLLIKDILKREDIYNIKTDKPLPTS